MRESSAILATVLAQADAYRLPVREWGGRASAVRCLSLRSLAGAGLPFLGTSLSTAGDGPDDAGRKAIEKRLDALNGEGLLIVSRAPGRRYPLVKLTARGEGMARMLCDVPARAAGRLLLAEVATKTERNPATLDRLWLAETALNGGKGWGDSTSADRRGLARIEMNYLPAASAEWIFGHSDIQGHAYYRVTLAGWREIDQPTMDDPKPKIERDPRADGTYRERQNVILAGMSTDTSWPSREIGFIPLPVSMRRHPCSPGHLDSFDWPGADSHEENDASVDAGA